ncbi:MAG: FUSC family membrane protein [Bacteroidota bacterium]
MKDPVSDTLLIMSGACGTRPSAWYFTGSGRTVSPSRPWERNLIAIAGYFRARGSLYKEGEDVDEGFIGVMEKQSTVLKCQEQAGEILFKTRQFVADTSPKGRSVMMIFIDSNDLLEQVMSSYQDYEDLHRTIGHTGLLNKFHDVIYKLSDELERIGLIIQSGAEVRDDVSLAISFHELEEALRRERENTNDINEISSLNAMTKTLSSLRRIANLVQRLSCTHDWKLKSLLPTLPGGNKPDGCRTADPLGNYS